jgi:Flp pilus assembly protein TadG
MVRRAIRFLPSRLERDERGAVLAFVALVMVVLIGFSALAIDVGRLYVTRAQLQAAADAAALAAVRELPDQDAAREAALTLVAGNLGADVNAGQNLVDAVTFGRWDADARAFVSGGTPVDSTRISLARSQATGNPIQTFFAGVLGHSQVDVGVRSVARRLAANTCFWALNPTLEDAVRIESGAQVTLDNCAFSVNSSHDRAIKAETGGCVEADGIDVVGGAFGSCYSPAPRTGASPLEDPLLALEAPSYGSCTYSSTRNLAEGGTHTVSPGVYCGGIKVGENATVTFQPGLYVLGGIGLKVEEGARVIAHDVTIYLTFLNGSWARVLVEDDSTLEISAASTGPLAGIAFFQDRATPASVQFVIEDVSSGTIEGTIYAPSIHFWLETRSGLDLTGAVVADRMTFETNARVHRSGDPMSLAPCGTGLVY